MRRISEAKEVSLRYRVNLINFLLVFFDNFLCLFFSFNLRSKFNRLVRNKNKMLICLLHKRQFESDEKI